MEKSVYAQIAARTGGDVYIGVVGPVRTGKSTLIKRIMETMVIPNIDDPYRKERAKDELPQSGSGKTIMTAEPKFVPEEAVEISPDDAVKLRVRMIDSVGYMIPGAVGAMEDGKERMVTTPWFDQEIPLTKAAELGTQKVMSEHCSVGLVVTTDGTITDIPRQDYVEAERRSIGDMQATGKPFVILINTKEPEGAAAVALGKQLSEQYGVDAYPVDCQAMDIADIAALLTELLYAFPMTEMQIHLPRWMDALEWEHPVKRELFDAIKQQADGIGCLRQAEDAVAALERVESVVAATVQSVDLGRGVVACSILFPDALYYEILSQRTGFPVSGEGELMSLLIQLSAIKRDYDKISSALTQAQTVGYGVVLPTRAEMKLEAPELVRKGGVHGVRLRACAPSIHIMRVDVNTEISPMVGSEQQAQELVDSLNQEFLQDEEKLWESNLFGKSVYEMIGDSMESKLQRIPDDVRMKFRSSLAKTVNEGASGMICILF